MNLQNHFRESCNKKRVHIEQLRILRDQTEDATIRQRLQKKITYERQQLAAITAIWDVA